MKKLIKRILIYPVMLINRIYIFLYYKTKNKNESFTVIEENKGKKILVLAPHVDDETIGLGGTIIKSSNSNNKMTLVYITDGSGSTSNKSIKETIEERNKEGYEIKESYGFSNIYFLDEVDGSLDSKGLEITNKMVRILEAEKPDIIFSPFMIDGNTDHVETTKILCNALQIWDTEFEQIFQYQVNTPIDPILVNRVTILNKDLFEKKLKKYKIFISQWAMGFGIFNLLDRGRGLQYNNSYAVEAFVMTDYVTLKEIINKLEANNYQPQLFKQISSEFTLISSFIKSKKIKKFHIKLIEDVIKIKELGGSSL